MIFVLVLLLKWKVKLLQKVILYQMSCNLTSVKYFCTNFDEKHLGNGRIHRFYKIVLKYERYVLWPTGQLA